MSMHCVVIRPYDDNDRPYKIVVELDPRDEDSIQILEATVSVESSKQQKSLEVDEDTLIRKFGGLYELFEMAAEACTESTEEVQEYSPEYSTEDY